jgi:pimeloyl-ACP methyl ester carboxylesterase
VPDQEWDRVLAAFGPHLPDQRRHARTPKNLKLNKHGMDLIRRLDILDQLNRVDTPTLVSVGDLDPPTPTAAAEEIIGALPAGMARLEVIAGAGHFAGWTPRTASGPSSPTSSMPPTPPTPSSPPRLSADGQFLV